MDKANLINIIENCESKPNADLTAVLELLGNEFEETKSLLLKLSEHLDKVEESYNKVNEELKKRKGG
jgi:hypothetical protein